MAIRIELLGVDFPLVEIGKPRIAKARFGILDMVREATIDVELPIAFGEGETEAAVVGKAKSIFQRFTLDLAQSADRWSGQQQG